MHVFFCQTLISKTTLWVKLFSPPLTKTYISWDEVEKSSLLQLSLSHYFSLSTMHEVVDEAILSNTFSKTAQFYLESHS